MGRLRTGNRGRTRPHLSKRATVFKAGETYTLIIARSGSEGARKYSLPVVLTSVVGLLGGVLFLSFLFSMLHYWWMAERTVHVVQLETEVARMRQENAGLRAVSGKLTDQISSLEVTATRLKFLSENDDDGMGGAGGPGQAARPLLTLDHGDLLKRFRTLDGRRMTLESELRRFQDYYTTRSILQSALPTVMPVRGYPSGGYGYRSDPFTGNREFHPGVDISAPRGAKVVATSDGEVTRAGWHHGYGRLVSLRHRFGIVTRYGHLAEVNVKVGQKVQRGDIVGYVGSTGRTTGPHLHYEIQLGSRPLNPVRFFRY